MARAPPDFQYVARMLGSNPQQELSVSIHEECAVFLVSLEISCVRCAHLSLVLPEGFNTCLKNSGAKCVIHLHPDGFTFNMQYTHITQYDKILHLNTSLTVTLYFCPYAGHLKVTTENGKNPSTMKYEALYAFGARSFSIRRADTMKLVYDSGDELAHKMALLQPDIFNANFDPNDEVSDDMDTRSDDKVWYKYRRKTSFKHKFKINNGNNLLLGTVLLKNKCFTLTYMYAELRV